MLNVKLYEYNGTFIKDIRAEGPKIKVSKGQEIRRTASFSCLSDYLTDLKKMGRRIKIFDKDAVQRFSGYIDDVKPSIASDAWLTVSCRDKGKVCKIAGFTEDITYEDADTVDNTILYTITASTELQIGDAIQRQGKVYGRKLEAKVFGVMSEITPDTESGDLLNETYTATYNQNGLTELRLTYYVDMMTQVTLNNVVVTTNGSIDTIKISPDSTSFTDFVAGATGRYMEIVVSSPLSMVLPPATNFALISATAWSTNTALAYVGDAFAVQQKILLTEYKIKLTSASSIQLWSMDGTRHCVAKLAETVSPPTVGGYVVGSCNLVLEPGYYLIVAASTGTYSYAAGTTKTNTHVLGWGLGWGYSYAPAAGLIANYTFDFDVIVTYCPFNQITYTGVISSNFSCTTGIAYPVSNALVDDSTCWIPRVSDFDKSLVCNFVSSSINGINIKVGVSDYDRAIAYKVDIDLLIGGAWIRAATDQLLIAGLNRVAFEVVTATAMRIIFKQATGPVVVRYCELKYVSSTVTLDKIIKAILTTEGEIDFTLIQPTLALPAGNAITYEAGEEKLQACTKLAESIGWEFCHNEWDQPVFRPLRWFDLLADILEIESMLEWSPTYSDADIFNVVLAMYEAGDVSLFSIATNDSGESATSTINIGTRTSQVLRNPLANTQAKLDGWAKEKLVEYSVRSITAGCSISALDDDGAIISIEPGQVVQITDTITDIVDLFSVKSCELAEGTDTIDWALEVEQI